MTSRPKTSESDHVVINGSKLNVNLPPGERFYIYLDNIEERIFFPDAPAEDVYIVSTSGSHTMTGDYSFTGSVTVPTPVNPSDAATKSYVDSAVVNLDYKEAARAGGDTNVPLNGPSPLVIDGVTIAGGDRVLLFGQLSAAENGIYVMNPSGPTYTLTRAPDAGQSGLNSGTFIYVSEGTSNGNHSYVLSTPDPIIVDTTPLTFVVFGATTTYSAGNGLQLTATTFSVASTVTTDNFIANMAVSTPKITTITSFIDFDANDLGNIGVIDAVSVNAANINAGNVVTNIGNVLNPVSIYGTTVTINSPTSVVGAGRATSLSTDTSLAFGTTNKITVSPAAAISAAGSYSLPVVAGNAAIPIVTGAAASVNSVLVSAGSHTGQWQPTTLPPGSVTTYTSNSVGPLTIATFTTPTNTNPIFRVRVSARIVATGESAAFDYPVFTKNISGTLSVTPDPQAGNFMFEPPFTGLEITFTCTGANLNVVAYPPGASATNWKIFIDAYY